jgi:hypothetical protein
MSSRLVPVLLLTAMLYALGAGIANLPHSLSPRQPLARIPFGEAVAIPTLPTVTVRPDKDALAALLPAATLLPTVTVRPSGAELAAAKALDARALGTGAVVVAMHALGGGMVPRSGLDMPYYSFGKTVYRLRKE